MKIRVRNESVVVPKDAGGTQSFNEFWLEVQERSIQDQQDVDKVTGEAFKLVGSRDFSQVFEGVQKVKVKPEY
jgi:hypothetical protein